MFTRIWLLVFVLAVGVAVAAPCLAEPMDLFAAIDNGLVTAEFRGDGDSSVVGTLQRNPGGPSEVTIPAGTVFVAQRPSQRDRGRRGYSPQQVDPSQGQYPRGGGGGGAQRMFSTGRKNVGLGNEPVQIAIATACIDYGLRTPGWDDVMNPTEPPSRELARLAEVLDKSDVTHPAAQLAAWALSDDIVPTEVQGYLRDMVGRRAGASKERRQLLSEAKKLLADAGLDTSSFRMFR